MQNIYFICPECGQESSIEEVNESKVFYELGYINKEIFETIPETEPHIEIVKRIGFQCVDCGYSLDGINTVSDLYHWLEKRGMLTNEN